jgi:hypothetical protein
VRNCVFRMIVGVEGENNDNFTEHILQFIIP